MVTEDAGADVAIDAPNKGQRHASCCSAKWAGRVVVETTDPGAVRQAFDGVAPVYELGDADGSGALDVTVNGESLTYDAGGSPNFATSSSANWRNSISDTVAHWGRLLDRRGERNRRHRPLGDRRDADDEREQQGR